MDQTNLTPRERRLAMVPLGARPGEGVLQWNLGGWIGAQLGSTVWLAICGCVTMTYNLGVGLGIVGCFLAANAIGFLLWRSRARLAPHLGVQLLCLAGLCAAGVTFALLYRIGLAQEIMDIAGGTGSLPLWAYLAPYPGMMLILAVVDRRGREEREPGR